MINLLEGNEEIARVMCNDQNPPYFRNISIYKLKLLIDFKTEY